MNGSPAATFAAILDAVGAGLPLLLLDFAVCLLLLVAGVAIYIRVTPFHERALIDQGNTAAGITLGGAVLALAIPLAALLATDGGLLDLLVWGIVALVFQLLTLAGVSMVLRNLKHMIESGNLAAAIALAASQIAVALLTAAVFVPN